MGEFLEKCSKELSAPSRLFRLGAEIVNSAQYEISEDFKIGSGINMGVDFIEFHKSLPFSGGYCEVKSGGELFFHYLRFWHPGSLQQNRFGVIFSGSDPHRNQMGVLYEPVPEDGVWYLVLGRRFSFIEVSESNPFVINFDIRGEIGYGNRFHFGADALINLGLFF